MRAYVTGATGFIGKHLVRALVERGDQVTCLIRPGSDTTALRVLGVEMNASPIFKGVEDASVVYHNAGVLGQRGIPSTDYFEAHVRLPQRLLMRMCEGQKFVYTSTGWVTYPQKTYERTKISGEKVVELSGIPHMIIRPGFVYGPGDMHHLPLFRWIKRLRRLFPIPGDGKNLVCPTFVSDVVTSILHYREGTYHVSGRAVTMNGFVIAIADALGVGRPIIHIPPVIKKDFFTTTRIWDVRVRPTELAIGLRATVEYYEKEGLL